MMRIIEDLASDWRRLDERIEGLSNQIEDVAHQDPACERLMTVPGIGPIISSAMVAAIGKGAVFTKGRDFGAWLGLVTRRRSKAPAVRMVRHGTKARGRPSWPIGRDPGSCPCKSGI
jgi:transposase